MKLPGAFTLLPCRVGLQGTPEHVVYHSSSRHAALLCSHSSQPACLRLVHAPTLTQVLHRWHLWTVPVITLAFVLPDVSVCVSSVGVTTWLACPCGIMRQLDTPHLQHFAVHCLPGCQRLWLPTLLTTSGCVRSDASQSPDSPLVSKPWSQTLLSCSQLQRGRERTPLHSQEQLSYALLAFSNAA